jgi:hypothetical protein
LAKKRRMRRLSSVDKAKEVVTGKTILPKGGSLTLIVVAISSVAVAIGVGLYARDQRKKNGRRFNYV